MKYSLFSKEPPSRTHRTLDIIFNIIMILLMTWFFLVYGIGIGQTRINIKVVTDCNGYISNWEDLPSGYNYSELQQKILEIKNKT